MTLRITRSRPLRASSTSLRRLPRWRGRPLSSNLLPPQPRARMVKAIRSSDPDQSPLSGSNGPRAARTMASISSTKPSARALSPSRQDPCRRKRPSRWSTNASLTHASVSISCDGRWLAARPALASSAPARPDHHRLDGRRRGPPPLKASPRRQSEFAGTGSWLPCEGGPLVYTGDRIIRRKSEPDVSPPVLLRCIVPCCRVGSGTTAFPPRRDHRPRYLAGRHDRRLSPLHLSRQGNAEIPRLRRRCGRGFG